MRINADPQDVVAWHDKIDHLIDLYKQSNEEILKTYDEMLSANPDYAEAIIGKGVWFETMMNEPKNALQCFQKALLIEPDNEEAQRGIERCSK
jgi:tetratricopeptide (TPR) repeat protein